MDISDLLGLEVIVLMIVLGRIKFRSLKLEEERKLREHKEAARNYDCVQRTKDYQLNHGRRIYNWLVEELKQYKDFGIDVRKIEENGTSFSIHIVRTSLAPSMFLDEPILQIDYDFFRYTDPYLGHIHYGAHGADILFWVGDHAPKAGLDRLVLHVVADEVRMLAATK